LIFTASALGVVVSLILLLSLELRRSYEREIDYAGSVSQSIARILEQQLLASMDRIDLIVQEAAVQYRDHRLGKGLPADRMNAMLARHLARVPGVLSLRLINESGDYVFDANGSASKANIADRRYFTQQRDNPDTGLFPEGPLFSRVVGRWTMTFSRGVRAPDGRFLGIVQSSMQTEALTGAFSTATMGTAEVVNLLNADGAIVARLPEVLEQIGKSNISGELRALIKAETPEAVYSATSGVDGVKRLYALRRVGQHPFYLIVGIPYDAILAQWKRMALIYGILSLVMLLGSVVMATKILARYSDTVRQAEEQRRLTSEVFASALEGIIVTDHDGRIITANDAMCDITGYGRDELLGQTVGLFRSDVHDASYFKEMWHTLERTGRWQGEIWNRRKSGEVFPEWLSVSKMVDPRQGDSRFIAVYTDISAQKDAERRLQATNVELVRLAEIMAHHLQEPARRLVTFAKRLSAALAGKGLGEDETMSLTFIEQQASRLRALIRDIQLYLAADQPMGEVELQSPSEVARKAVATRAKELAEMGATVEVEPQMPMVVLDRRRLADIFLILLDNAIRYGRGDGPLRIRISARGTGAMVVLRFADNGPGIDPRFRERAFQVFERLHHQAGDDSTGIGLAVVRRIVEHGRGRAWIEETQGGGATVALELPMGQSK
jgi:PAS domain S-box-containing protein